MVFAAFGLLIGQAGLGLHWSVLVYAGLSLTLVRMLPVAVSMAGTGIKSPTVAFLGWFGPRGLASILFALLILEETDTGGQQTILVVTMVTVTASILLHRVTAAPGARRYGSLADTMGALRGSQDRERDADARRIISES